MAAEPIPTVLAFDSAGGACSAALLRDGALVARRWEEMDRGHGEVLMPMIETVTADCGYAALDLICVGTGPGGYTGLRIAIAAARGLALATGLPVLGVDNLQLHQQQVCRAHPGRGCAVILETRRADFYLQTFAADGTSLDAPSVVTADAVAERLALRGPGLVLAGDAATRFAETGAASDDAWAGLVQQHADSAELAMLGARRFSEATHTPLSPLYLRPPDVSPPGADRQRLR